MDMPTIMILLILTFPLFNFNIYSGQFERNHYDYKSLVACSYKTNSVLYSDDSVSDNNTNGGEIDESFNGVTQDTFNTKMESLQTVLENVETHQIETQSLLNQIFELITYIAGFSLFIVLVLLLRYIYKFFKMFF